MSQTIDLVALETCQVRDDLNGLQYAYLLINEPSILKEWAKVVR